MRKLLITTLCFILVSCIGGTGQVDLTNIKVFSQLSFIGVDSTSNITANSVKLNWTHVRGAISYMIYETSGSNAELIGVTLAPSTTFVVGDLSANTSYSFRVRLVDNKGLSDSNENDVEIETLEDSESSQSSESNSNSSESSQSSSIASNIPQYNPQYTTPNQYNQQYQQLYGYGQNYCQTYQQGCIQCQVPQCQTSGCDWGTMYYAQPGYYNPNLGYYGQGGSYYTSTTSW